MLTPIRSAAFLLLLSLLALVPLSCVDQKDLGDNFELVESERGDANILYCFQDCGTSGIPAVPAEVIQVEHDSRWIVAKTIGGGSDSTAYWIVDKDIKADFDYDVGFTDSVKANVYGPLDSLRYAAMLRVKSIELDLK